MSRATDLRDAVAAELATAFDGDGVIVETVVTPRYMREEVANGKIRMPVLCSSRTFQIDMGPDTRAVGIAAGIASAIEPSKGFSLEEDTRRKQRVQAFDKIDGLFEKLIALWTPADGVNNGLLANKILAEHRFNAIEQAAFIDTELYKEHGVIMELVVLTYIDTLDI